MANPYYYYYYYTSRPSHSSSIINNKSACSLLLLIFIIMSMLLSSSSCAQLNEINGATSSINLDDLEALRAIRDSLTDLGSNPATGFFSTWDFSTPNPNPCFTFSGVVCSPLGRVDILSLGPGLSGSLSPSLSKLTQLTQLILYPGLVTGPIPPQLGPPTLRVISLTHNRLTGPIPTSLSSLPNLHTLDLSFNSLTGAIPPSLFSHQQLRILVLSSNSLSGQLPGEVTTQLLHVDLKDNQITGQLPWQLPSSLRYLSVSNNLMWGPLTLNNNGSYRQQLQLLSDLEYLDLSMNHFSGAIPPSLLLLLNNYSLSSLFLQRNNLSGPLPQVGPQPTDNNYDNNNNSNYMGERSVGVVVDLSHNMLSGELTTLALVGVESLYLNNNLFTGRVPREYVEGLTRGTTKTLYLQHNYFTQFPLGPGEEIPDAASLCMCYNCMLLQIPQWTVGCPTSAGSHISRPISQCKVFNNNRTEAR